MLPFCGMDVCRVDDAGRIRLTARTVEDFLRRCEGEVVLFGLPEGAVAVYPEEVYREMRRRELGDLDSVGTSFAARRSLRRFGSMASQASISRQGRLTLPEVLRRHAALAPGRQACVVGVEIGVEIWAKECFDAEMREIRDGEEIRRRKELAIAGEEKEQ
ncbi:MAG: hypothetical protein MJ016_05285 [Victivallaceae bacterium]|nr:hypothetical protein [Victivallaceae bacterium]